MKWVNILIKKLKKETNKIRWKIQYWFMRWLFFEKRYTVGFKYNKEDKLLKIYPFPCITIILDYTRNYQTKKREKDVNFIHEVVELLTPLTTHHRRNIQYCKNEIHTSFLYNGYMSGKKHQKQKHGYYLWLHIFNKKGIKEIESVKQKKRYFLFIKSKISNKYYSYFTNSQGKIIDRIVKIVNKTYKEEENKK